MDNRKLFKVEDYIADILNKRNIMLNTALMEASDKNDRERTMEFFQRMTEKLEDAKRNVQSLLEQRHSDSQFWKNESILDYKEIKKIFDKLGCDADRVF